MECLPADTLYCVRQSCQLFMNTFDRKPFEDFHVKTDHLQRIGSTRARVPHTRHKLFETQVLSSSELNDIANALNHHKYCSSCLQTESSGVLATKMRDLSERLYCQGCEETHPAALFLPEDVARFKNGTGSLVCIGRLGKVTLCDHTTSDAVFWKDVEQYRERASLGFQGGYVLLHCDFTCPDWSHMPMGCEQWSNSSVAFAMPRMTIRYRNTVPATVYVGYGWDLPLLHMEKESMPTLSSIKKSLQRLAPAALQNHGHHLCPHMSAEKDIREFVRTGICECFTKYEMVAQFDAITDCECQRQEYIECRICGAMCMWRHWKGVIALSYRYSWDVRKPTSIGWLGLLNKHYRDRILDEDRRHVFWCDEPECRTNTRPRWEAVIKDASDWRHLEQEGLTGDHHKADWGIMLAMSFATTFENW